MKTYKYFYLSFSMILFAILVLIFFGQPYIATSGRIYFWSATSFGPDTSQHISDWYSFSHFLHGIIFFFLINFFYKVIFKKEEIILKEKSALFFFIAVCLESFWEILENTPMVIDRYRQGALAAGYFGDSILNSTFDILFMCVGFLFANKFSWKISLATLIFIELFTLYFIRDNLTLNIIMLLHPSTAISNWQIAL